MAGFWPTVNVKTVFKITYGSATSWRADCIKIGNQFRGNLKHRGLQVLAKVPDRKCTRDHQDVVRPLQKPSERDLHGRGTEARSDVRQRTRLEWSEPTEWKEWHVGDAVAGKIGYERIIGPMREVVVVLYADDRSDPPGFLDLRRA